MAAQTDQIGSLPEVQGGVFFGGIISRARDPSAILHTKHTHTLEGFRKPKKSRMLPSD